ncbi:transporter substrate-binding protein [Brevibacillus reuszeri]|uniref:transporter substrate-binding protein n=1 Tax=Brevibacillus reuszeri TaxID=54915 RepID=UPI003D21A5CC
MHIKVGLLFSLTGTTALTEKGQCDAARLAIEEGSHGPYKIEAIIRDICSDPRKSAQEAEAMAKEGVRIFIGCYTSACRKAILPVLEKFNCLLVYPTLYEGQECHPNVIYTGELPNQQVYTLLDYLTRHYGKRVYCIGTDYVYPRETNQQVQSFLRDREGAVIKEQYVPFGHQHFQEVWSDILSQEPDAIFSTLVGKSIIPFYRDQQRLGTKRKKVPIFSPITKETELEAIGAEYGAGHYSSASYFQSLPTPENLAFIRRFQQFTGEKRAISSVMYNTYLGTKMVLDTIVEARSTNHRKIYEHMSKKTFETACGTMLVDTTHRHLSRPVKIGKSLSNGQFEIVWDSERNIVPRPFHTSSRTYTPLSDVVLKAWGNMSEEAVVAISEQGTVIYVSSKAEQLTSFAHGQSVTPAMLQAMHQTFLVTPYAEERCQIYLVKPRMAPAAPSPTASRFGGIQTVHPGYQRELEIARIAAQSTANVLILGETGTGKEVMAESIHRESDRKNGPFIAVNTALLPKDLIASELFGFVDGAFTGAKKGGAIGKFEAAHNGTIFLDEIGDMPLELQVVLLRVIESKKIVRLGESRERAINVRIIAATNRNLAAEMVANQSFRPDLFYRLNVLSITIPSLMDRPEDIEHLCQELIHECFLTYGDGPQSFQKEALHALVHHPWPGNIRELRNVIERAFLLARQEKSDITPEHLPPNIRNTDSYLQQPARSSSLKSLERQVIEQALQKTKSVTEASQFLGIARSTLYRKIKSYY